MPAVGLPGRQGYKKNWPKYLIKIESAARMSVWAHMVIKRMRKAAREKVPLAVKAYCPSKDVAEFWAGIWYGLGLKPELLLTSTVYFEVQPAEWETLLSRLPSSKAQFVFVERNAPPPAASVS